jgi:hypothetical protein
VLRQTVELVGECEDEMEVWHGQEFGTPGFDPTLLGERLTLRAVAVATRVVNRTADPTAVTGLPMPTEGGGTTGLDGAQGAELDAGMSPRSTHGVPVLADDIGQLRSRASLRRCPVRKRTGHDSVAHGLREIQQVEW